MLKGSTIVFIGTILGSVFSYLLNMLMGRMLGPVAYGELTALMSFMLIIGVAGGAIFTVSMRYSGELIASQQRDPLKKLFNFLNRYIVILALIIFLLGMLLIKPIAHFFIISDLIPIVITMLSIFAGLLIFINRGFLQGGQKFKAVSILGVAEAVFKIIIAIILVKIGLGLNGAVAAMVLGTAMAYIISFIPLKRIFTNISQKKTLTAYKFDRKELLNYSWPTLLAAILIMLATNLDIILVKHFFSPEEAGLYAAISAVGKIIIYLTAPIIGVMFPMVSEQKIKGEKHYRVFLFSVFMTLVGALLIVAVYTVAPGMVISILYGQRYLSLYYLLPEIGIAMVFFSLINLICNYYLAIKNFTFLWFFALILLVQITVISFWHPSILAMVRVFIFSYASLFIFVFGYYLLTKKEQLKQYISENNI